MAGITPETPAHWRHLRIQANGKKWALRTGHLNNPLFATDRKYLKVERDTESLTLTQAMEIGEQVEALLGGQSPEPRRKRA